MARVTVTHLRAFAWLRWRLLVNGVRGARKRDTLEQVSRILALVGPALLVVMSLGSLVALAVAGALGGYVLAGGSPSGEVIVFAIRIIAVLILLMVVFMPVSLGAGNGAARYARLLLLPISRRLLHFVEVLSGVADPWIFVAIPALLLVAAGLAAGGAVTGALLAAVAGLGLVAAFLALGALSGFLVGWLMRDRRRAELSTLIFVVALSTAGLLPQLLGGESLDRNRQNRQEERESRRPTVARIEEAIPRWTRALPTEMYGQVLTRGVIQQDVTAAAGWAAALWGQVALVYWLSGLAHRRVLTDAGGRARRTGVAGFRPFPQVPGLATRTSAVAIAQFKSGIRSMRGRLAVLLPGPMMALLSLVFTRSTGDADWISRIPEHGYVVFGGSLLFALLALHPIALNQFASDRAGLTLQWLLPLSARDLVLGKAAGVFLIFGTAMGLALIVIGATTHSGSVVMWTATVLGGVATFTILTPYGAMISAVLPVASDLSKNGSAGNPHNGAAIPGVFLTALASLPAVGVLLLSLRWGPWASLGLMAFWVLVAGAIAIPLLRVVTRAVTARRENLFLTVSMSKR
jgi:hypothetical protein